MLTTFFEKMHITISNSRHSFICMSYFPSLLEYKKNSKTFLHNDSDMRNTCKILPIFKNLSTNLGILQRRVLNSSLLKLKSIHEIAVDILKGALEWKYLNLDTICTLSYGIISMLHYQRFKTKNLSTPVGMGVGGWPWFKPIKTR